MHHRTRTHRAGLNCNKQVAPSQAMATDGFAGLSQRDDLGMRRGILLRNVAVPPAAHDLFLEYDRGAHRNFSHLKGALRTAQRLLHPEFVLFRTGLSADESVPRGTELQWKGFPRRGLYWLRHSIWQYCSGSPRSGSRATCTQQIAEILALSGGAL